MPFDTASYILGQRNAGGGGGGGDITVEALSVTENGTTTAPAGKAYSPVVVNVPNSYAAGDEGKVVSNGALVSQTAHAEVTSNGTVDTTLNDSVTVNVPNSYSASDEGKVVDNGALVAQTSDTVTTNGTYDTTLINSLTVNVSGGGGGTLNKIASGTWTGNGNMECTVPVGTKMPNTNFVFHMYVVGGTEFAYNSTYKFSELTCIISDKIATYDLSTNGTKPPVYTGNITWKTNNAGTIKDATAYQTGFAKYVRNDTTGTITQSQTGRPSIIRSASGFSLFYSQGNGNYIFVNGLTYYWDLYYFGDNRTNEIVEVV